jgi:hypothetical protein
MQMVRVRQVRYAEPSLNERQKVHQIGLRDNVRKWDLNRSISLLWDMCCGSCSAGDHAEVMKLGTDNAALVNLST